MVNIFSSGGGVQSTAVLVLSAQGKIDYPVHVFANVGERSESPKTIQYVRDVIRPYAERQGIEWVEVRKVDRHGNPVDLRTFAENSPHTNPLPMRMAGSGSPGRRSCTSEWKVAPVAKHLRTLLPPSLRADWRRHSQNRDFAPTPLELIGWQDMPRFKGRSLDWVTKKLTEDKRRRALADFQRERGNITLGLGISTDEARRVRDSEGLFYTRSYPLIELGLSRSDCLRIVADAGLPQPPKSSCYFCPYTKREKWQSMRTEEPELFWSAVELEKNLHAKHLALGRGGCFMNGGDFLDALTSPDIQGDLFDSAVLGDSECDSGHCWT